jgi:L-lactate dehydrogenase complex protein LldE
MRPSIDILYMSVQVELKDPMTDATASPQVLLLPTCLVDLFRPAVGFAAADLLERAGCRVAVSEHITCCGQPGYNAGDRALAIQIAQQVIERCEPYDYIVIPSGSCAGMLRRHYPLLFADDSQWAPRARAVAAKTFELTAFLADVRKVTEVHAEFPHPVTYHDSCSGLRELGVRAQPRALLRSIPALSLQELQGREVCCGFGGLFCAKYPDISDRMVSDKCAAVTATQAEVLLGGDLGCLMNIAGKLSRSGSQVQVRHVAEVLAGRITEPPLCADPDYKR